MKFKIFQKISLSLAIILFFIIILFVFNSFFLIGGPRLSLFEKISSISRLRIQKCLVDKMSMEVRGNSLSPLITSGQEIEALFKYYDCNSIKRDDIVLVNYAGNDNFLIKIIRGLPGDNFELKERNDGWNIFINGEVLKNSEGQEYLIFEKGYQMLSLYERDYNNKVPKAAYLVLGNKPSGSLDSTRFGLIDKSNIVAKVKY